MMIAIRGRVGEIRSMAESSDRTVKDHADRAVLSVEFTIRSDGPPLGVKGLDELLRAATDADVMLVIGSRPYPRVGGK
jgi:hypothetical protein